MSDVTATGDAVTTITSGEVPANKPIRRSFNPENKAIWARNEKYKKLWHDYYTSADRERARSNMVKALWDELSQKALYLFSLKSAEGWNDSALEQMLFAAEDFAQESTVGTIQKLDSGYFERENDASSFNAFRTYVAMMKRRVCHGRAQDELIKLNKYEPMPTSGPDNSDEENPEGEEALFHKGLKPNDNCLSVTPEHIQLSLLHRQDKDSAELTAAYNQSGCNATETAALLGTSTAAATKRLYRLKNDLRKLELEAILQQLFGEANSSKAATAILPLIPVLFQRPTNQYPTSLQEALTLKLRPKTRRVADDKPQSNWHQAVRWLYRLWVQSEVSRVVSVENTEQIADTSPANCQKAFEDILCRFQEYGANAGGLEAIKYGRGAEVGKATHTGSSQTIVPSPSDFICDVSLAARRSLTTDEYAYFKRYYESLDVVVQPEDRSCLEAHIASFLEHQRAAVKSLDNKIRLKLGARLIEVGIYPFPDYIKPIDTRRAKALPQVEATAEPKGKLLPWPTEETIDIQACADCAKFLTPDEAAEYLGGLNSRTVTRWAREGYFPLARVNDASGGSLRLILRLG